MLRTLLAILLLTLTMPAYAAEISPEGAQHLKTMLESLIEKQKNRYFEDHNTRPVFEGKVTVEQTNTYYAVTLPFYKVLFDDGRRMDFGMVSINVSPDDTNPKRWKMAMAVPTPIIMYDAENKPLLKISLGAQRSAGIWDEDFENFTKLTALYSDITFETPGAPFKALIPKALVRYDINIDDKNLATGNGFVLLEDILVDMGKENSQGKINAFRLDFTVDGYNFKDFTSSRDRLLALTQGLSTEGLDTKARDKEIKAALEMLYNSLGNRLNIEYSLSGVRFKKTSGEQEQTLNLDNAKLGLDIGGFTDGKVFAGAIAQYEGFSIDSPELDKDLLPADFKVDLKVHNIPFKEVTSVVQSTLKAGAASPDTNSMAMMNLMIKLPTLLSQAETKIKLTESHIGNKNYRFVLDGIVQADITAVNNATANITGYFNGLDWLISHIQNLQQTDAQNADKYFDMLKQLQTLKAFGKKDETADTYRFEFLMTPEGEIKMNGLNAQGLLNGGAPAKAPVTP